MSDPFLDDINGELTKLRERQIIRPARPRRPDWFWPALLGSGICVGFGAGETWIAFTGSGSIITGLLLAAIGLFVLSECWPWMWEERSAVAVDGRPHERQQRSR